MAKVALEVIEWAQHEADALEGNDAEVLDEDLVAEFLLEHVLKMISDQIENDAAAKASEQDESETPNILDELTSLSQMVNEIDIVVEKVAPTQYSKAMEGFLRNLAFIWLHSPLRDAKMDVTEFLLDDFSQTQADFKQSTDLEYLTFMSGRSANILNIGRHLRILKLNSFLEECLTLAAKNAIYNEIEAVSSLPFDSENLLSSLLMWFNDSVLGFIALVLNEGQMDMFKLDANNNKWKKPLLEFLYAEFARTRIAQCFDLIVEFPESTRAIKDLSKCLEVSNKYSDFVYGLRSALKRRLLVPGATSENILQIYVSIIKVLKIIDSSGVLMEAVSKPVSEYMKKRSDTIRCIVGSLTDENDDVLALYRELKDSSTTLQDAIDEDDDDNGTDKKEWTPEPLHLLPSYDYDGRLRSHDILSMLVHIYGSKELFMNEYANVLSDKLLDISDFNAEKEIQNVELLKVKFGENALSKCEVMLKDLADSKRINSLIHQKLEKKESSEKDEGIKDLHPTATVISGLFWPKIEEEQFSLPPAVEEEFESFAEEYKLNKNRSLFYKHHLGSVDLSLDFPDESVDFNGLTPFQATAIMAIAKTGATTIDELAEQVGVSTDYLQKKMAFWINNGVVRFDGETYKMVENASQIGAEAQGTVVMEETDDAPKSAQEQAEAELLAQIESFMSGMLAIHGSMTLDRIHSMFSMVLDGYNTHVQSEPQLAKLLDKLVAKHVLAVAGFTYTLAPTE